MCCASSSEAMTPQCVVQVHLKPCFCSITPQCVVLIHLEPRFCSMAFHVATTFHKDSGSLDWILPDCANSFSQNLPREMDSHHASGLLVWSEFYCTVVATVSKQLFPSISVNTHLLTCGPLPSGLVSCQKDTRSVFCISLCFKNNLFCYLLLCTRQH